MSWTVTSSACCAAASPIHSAIAKAFMGSFGRYHSPMIQVTVNGAAQRLEAPVALGALLERMALAGKKIAVERNGEIVPRSAHPTTLLHCSDPPELWYALGGG